MRMKRRGANVIEFALTAPVFFGIMLGVMDYGWLFASQAGIDNATSLACREGALVDPLVGNPQAVAETELDQRSKIFCRSSRCTTTVSDILAVPDRTLQCDVAMRFSPLIGFVPVPDQITSRAYYRMEWQRNR